MTNNDDQDIKQRAIRVIADVLGKEDEDISPETRFVEDLGVNSMEIVTLAVMLEEEFGGTVPEDELGTLHTVGDLMKYIHSRLENS